ncbi:hypothetical protein ATPR_2545 [Acetobacter tropicalis NBRC 101654]|uniref:Uncharacterized protein n=1 Tax=Acetobacter tropicalis NBRC 101654 TaxID=749388 RepID=F7VGP6_9PROT|nr:hypothetical protein ATPR_2545 [Acetobacter tropicalis NBRC 101654]
MANCNWDAVPGEDERGWDGSASSGGGDGSAMVPALLLPDSQPQARGHSGWNRHDLAPV